MSAAQIEADINNDKTLQALFVPNTAILDVPPHSRNPETGEIHKATLLFLDVDGVLNGHFSQIIHQTLPFPDSGNSDKGYVSDAHASSPIAAALINKLCKATGALIVLSSSWRVGMTMWQIPKMLEAMGIDPVHVIGRTDTLRSESEVRGHQIDRFLKDIVTEEGRAHMLKYDMLCEDTKFGDNVSVDAYAIIDDDSDMMEHQLPYFVQTTFMDGFLCSHAIELGKILSNDDTFYLDRLGGTINRPLW